MDFISENYVLIIIVGSFIIFALIGYLIDMLRGVNNKKEEYSYSVKPVEISDIKDDKTDSNHETRDNEDNLDDLLSNYENEIK